jgi:hypothetical protein
MKLRPDLRRNWIVALAFSGFILACLAGAMLVGLVPSFEEKCVQQCKPLGLDGRMVLQSRYFFRADMTRMRHNLLLQRPASPPAERRR